MATVLKVCKEEPPRLQSRCKEAPAELVAITHRALQRERDQRYQSAAELAKELEAFLDGRRVRVYEYSTWELVQRLLRRNRPLTYSALAFSVALLVALVVIVLAYRQAEVSRIAAVVSRDQASAARDEVQQREFEARFALSRAYVEHSTHLMTTKRRLEARVFAAKALLESPLHPLGPHHDPQRVLRADEHEEMARLEMAHRHSVTKWQFDQSIRAFDGPVSRVRLSPDLQTLVAADEHGRLRIWRREREGAWTTAQSAPELGPSAVRAMGFSHCGRYLAVAAVLDEAMVLWDLVEGREQRRIPTQGVYPLSVTFSKKGDHLLVSGRGVHIFDIPSGARLASGHEALEYGSTRTAVFGIGELVWSGTQNGAVWAHTPELAESGLRAEHVIGMNALHWVKDGDGTDDNRLLGLFDDGFVFDLSMDTGVFTTSKSGEWLLDSSVSGSGRYILVAGLNHVAVLDTIFPDKTIEQGFETTERIELGWRGARSVDFAADDSMLVWGDGEGTLHLWKWAFPPSWHRTRFSSAVLRLLLHPKEDAVSVVLMDAMIELQWGVSTPSTVDKNAQEGRQILDTLWSSGRRFRVSFDFDAQSLVVQREGEDWARMLGIDYEALFWFGVASSADGRLMAAIDKEQQLRLLDLEKRSEIEPLRASLGRASAPAMSADGRWAAMGSHEGRLALWSVGDGQLQWTRTTTGGLIQQLAFSADSRWLASSHNNGDVLVWNVEGGEGRPIGRHEGRATALAFSPDSKTLASGGTEGRVKLWDVELAQMSRVLDYKQAVTSLVFSRDAQHLLVSTTHAVWDELVVSPIWRVPPQALLAEALAAAGPAVHLPEWATSAWLAPHSPRRDWQPSPIPGFGAETELSGVVVAFRDQRDGALDAHEMAVLVPEAQRLGPGTQLRLVGSGDGVAVSDFVSLSEQGAFSMKLAKGSKDLALHMVKGDEQFFLFAPWLQSGRSGLTLEWRSPREMRRHLERHGLAVPANTVLVLGRLAQGKGLDSRGGIPVGCVRVEAGDALGVHDLDSRFAIMMGADAPPPTSGAFLAIVAAEKASQLLLSAGQREQVFRVPPLPAGSMAMVEVVLEGELLSAPICGATKP